MNDFDPTESTLWPTWVAQTETLWQEEFIAIEEEEEEEVGGGDR